MSTGLAWRSSPPPNRRTSVPYQFCLASQSHTIARPTYIRLMLET